MAKKWLPQSRWPYDLVFLVLFCGVTRSCPPEERRLLMTCLEPLSYLQENPNYPSQKACNIILNLIDCVEQRLLRCHGFVRVHDALNIAESLKAEFCNVEATEEKSTPGTAAATITTVTPRTTFTTRPSSVPAKGTKIRMGVDHSEREIDHKFQLCRDMFSKHDPKNLSEGCRLAEAFLDCGSAVLQAYKVSLDTLYLHAELLRNSAIYWEHCSDERTSVQAVRNAKKGMCQTHVIQHLKDCLVATKHMVKGNEKPFCSLVPSYLPCIAPVVNKCSHLRQFDRVANFLMDSLDLQRLHCISTPPIFSEAEAKTTPLPKAPGSAKKDHEQSGEDPLHASSFSKTENSVGLNKQHASNQLKKPSKGGTAGLSSTSDFRKSGSRRRHQAPKASASELPETRDSADDEVTRTGSGDEETGSEGVNNMRGELSSGEGKIFSSELHERTEGDGSLLEDDPSGSGASWQEEVKIDSSTAVYQMSLQPKHLSTTAKTTKTEKQPSRSLSPEDATHKETSTDAPKLASGYSALGSKEANMRNRKNKEHSFPKKDKQSSASIYTRRISDKQENKTVVDYEVQRKKSVGSYGKEKQPLDEERGKAYADLSSLSPSTPTLQTNTEDKYIPETTPQTLSSIMSYYTKQAGENHDTNTDSYRGEENKANVYTTKAQSTFEKAKSQKNLSRKFDQSSQVSHKPSTNRIQKKSEVRETTMLINNHVNEPATEEEADSYGKEDSDSISYYYENVEEAQEENEGKEEDNLFSDELGEWSTLQPWGSGCSKPFDGSQYCTSIMMTTQLGHHESKCRGLRSYVSCLRALMVACENVPSFETIRGTIRNILIYYRQRCMA